MYGRRAADAERSGRLQSARLLRAHLLLKLLRLLEMGLDRRPQIALDPTQGPAGSSVHVTGTGFDQTPCGVNLYFDKTSEPAIGTATVTEGAFEADVTIPDGEAAGQTILHFHVHVIPRYQGDVLDPRGGVRWVLPDKAAYWLSTER